jgi:hypothetical protein
VLILPFVLAGLRSSRLVRWSPCCRGTARRGACRARGGRLPGWTCRR